MSASPALFESYALSGLTLRNRVTVSPMCQYSAVDGLPQVWHRQHLGALAVSGAGLIILEATAVEEIGRITHGCLGLYNDAQEAALTAMVSEMKALGATAVGIQLGHAGRKASTQRPWEGDQGLPADDSPWQTVAPSAIPFGPERNVPTAATEQDLARIRDAFVASAQRALRAGFDLIELHGAHGYLLHEFCSPHANQRSDNYGGCLENRMRFPLEVAAAVRRIWPAHMPLGMRITGSDWTEEGITTDDAVALAAELKKLGLNYVVVSSGGIMPGIKIAVGPGYQVPFAERVKREVGIPTMALGMIVQPTQAEAIIQEGRADLVALARGFIDDPRWVWHAADKLGAPLPLPVQYLRGSGKAWPGNALLGR